MPGQKGQTKAAPSATPSRESFPCPVEKCKVEKRRDKLMEHISKAVKYDVNGKALNPLSGAFASLNSDQKIHTEFFHKNNFDKKTSIKEIVSGQPSRQKQRTPILSPFDLAARGSARKRQIQSGSGDVSVNPKRRLILPDDDPDDPVPGSSSSRNSPILQQETGLPGQVILTCKKIINVMYRAEQVHPNSHHNKNAFCKSNGIIVYHYVYLIEE